MRVVAAVVLATILPANVFAQHGPSGAPVSIGQPRIGLPLPSIGLPLSPIGLPLPRIGLSPMAPDRTGIHPMPRADGPIRSNRRDHLGADRRYVPGIFYVIPYGWNGYAYGWDTYAPGSVTTSAPPERKPSKGRMRVELQPAIDAQMYVDGYYVGLLSEFTDGLPLDPGPHSLQLRADGYQPLTINVQVSEGRSITYRGSLPATSPSPAPAPPVPDSPRPIEPRSPTGPVYFIPGCYLGNVPPQELTLPPGCDPAGAIQISRQ